MISRLVERYWASVESVLGRSGGWFRLRRRKRRASRLLVRAGAGVGYDPNGAQGSTEEIRTFCPDGLCVRDDESCGGIGGIGGGVRSGIGGGIRDGIRGGIRSGIRGDA